MKLKDLFASFNITQEELAGFMGIPRPRIAQWIAADRDYPPKAEDLKLYNIAVNFFTNTPADQLKTLVTYYQIVDGKVKKRTQVTEGVVNEPEMEYQKSEKNDTEGEENPLPTDDELLNLSLSKNYNFMTSTILHIMKKQADANADDAKARLLQAQTSDRLSFLLEKFYSHHPDESMHVKPTGG